MLARAETAPMPKCSIRDAQALIHQIPDYPEPGIIFQDVMPVLANGDALQAVVRHLIEPFAGMFDVVAGVEARGFLLAGAVAAHTGVGMLPIRKAGKLPRPAAKVRYTLEYGSAAIEAQADIAAGARVLILDDVLATGGTLSASETLINKLGATVVGHAVLLEIVELGGRKHLTAPLHCVFPEQVSGYTE